jgi:O-acetyl-ADP-ribose deacetylase (regulator of RNase III)
MDPRYSVAFTAAKDKYGLPDSVRIDTHIYPMSHLPESVKFDTVVSPANSYGRLDGTFDDAISRAFAPRDDYFAVTRAAQRLLYDKYRGFAPPGSCTILRIPEEFHARSRNVWGTKRIALCPTMRVPQDVRWDREVVYDCMWSLLCAVGNHNRDVREGKVQAEGEEEIQSVLMTPLATGCGAVSAERWAAQAVLAMKHYTDACENEETWSALEWPDCYRPAYEVERTWQL